MFVTGCDSGFGNLLCKRLDRRGFRVIAGCLTEKGADDLKRATGPYLKTVLLDVTSTASIQKAMEYTKQEVGDNGEKPFGVGFVLPIFLTSKTQFPSCNLSWSGQRGPSCNLSWSGQRGPRCNHDSNSSCVK